MPVFTKNNKKILFIHVPKAGGTSIEHFLIDNGWKMSFFDGGGENSWNVFLKCSPQHMHAEMLKNIMRLAAFDASFMIVRHPLARIKSEFKWRKKHSFLEKQDISYNDWIKETLSLYNTNNFIYDNHIRPQNEFELENSKVFCLEDGLNDIIKFLETTLNEKFNSKAIPHVMTSNVEGHNNIFDIDSDNMNLVTNFYKGDFDKYYKGKINDEI